MAYRLFQGADWIAAGFNPASLPVANDEVVVPEGITHNKTDLSANFSGIDLNLLKTHRDFSGDFGASGAPLEGAADLIVHEGGGGFYFVCSTALTTDEVRIQARNNGVVAELDSTGTGDYTKIIVNRGIVTLPTSIIFAGSPKVVVGSVDNILEDARLIVAAGAPTLAELLQMGGRTTLHNVVTDLRISAGTCVKESAAATNVDLLGGTLVYNHAAASGDVALIEVHAGATLDFMRSVVTTGAGVRRTIDKVIAYPGANVLYDPETTAITVFEDYRTGLR